MYLKGEGFIIFKLFAFLFLSLPLAAPSLYAQDKEKSYFPEELKAYFNAYYRCFQENSLSKCNDRLVSDVKALLGEYAKDPIIPADSLQGLEKSINRIIQPLNCKSVLFAIPDSKVINCWLAESITEKREERLILGRRICADVIYMDNLVIRDYLYFSTKGLEMLDAGTKYSSVYFNLEAFRNKAGDTWDFFQGRGKEKFSRRYAPSKLDRLRKHIQHNAWGGLYKEALGKNKDLEKAKAYFVDSALEQIKENSLLHELAHIYVRDTPQLRFDTSEEEEFAFLMELAYGKIPFETLDTVIGIYAKGLKEIYHGAVEDILEGFINYIQKQKLSGNAGYKDIPMTGNYLKDKIRFIYTLSEGQIRDIASLLLDALPKK